MRNIILLLTLVLVACGPDDKHFAIDGQLLNLNQGEFLVYSPDGVMESVDTITVKGGRFEYVGTCLAEGTAIIVMPNGQKVPVFVEPGGSYTVKGNAQNLKALTVKGGDSNKLMNSFRESIADLSARQSPSKQIREFVKANPASVVSPYIIRSYLLESDKPDCKTATELLDMVLKEQKNNPAITVLRRKTGAMKMVSVGSKLPSFSVSDIDGKTVSSEDMASGVWIICSFATWDFESTNGLRRIKGIKTEKSKDWHVVGVSMDASKVQCRNSMSYDKDEYTIVCDEKMTETALAQQFCMPRTSVVVVVKDGKIIYRTATGEPFYKYLKEKM